MVPHLCLYHRYWWNKVNFSSAMITFDILYLTLEAQSRDTINEVGGWIAWTVQNYEAWGRQLKFKNILIYSHLFDFYHYATPVSSKQTNIQKWTKQTDPYFSSCCQNMILYQEPMIMACNWPYAMELDCHGMCAHGSPIMWDIVIWTPWSWIIPFIPHIMPINNDDATNNHTSNCHEFILFAVQLSTPAYFKLPDIWITMLELPEFPLSPFRRVKFCAAGIIITETTSFVIFLYSPTGLHCK